MANIALRAGKPLLLCLMLFAGAFACSAQSVWPVPVSSDPTGKTCTAQQPSEVYNSHIYVCIGGAFQLGPPGAVMLCQGSPGNTVGPLNQLCANSAGTVWICPVSGGCTTAGQWVSVTGSGSFSYPSSGVPCSTGSAWCSSYQVGTAASDLVQLNGSGQLPAVSGALLTNLPSSSIAIGGTVTSGTAQNTLFIGSTGVLAQDNTYRWYPAATPGVNGQTGLLLGLTQPDFSVCCDGPSNSIGISRDSPVDLVLDGAGGASTGAPVLSIYAARGTHASLANLQSGDSAFGMDYYGYVGGAYAFIAGLGVTYNGAWNAFSLDANEFQFGLINTAGLAQVNTAEEVEFNGGTPVADGGSLVQLDVANLKDTGLTASTLVSNTSGKVLESATVSAPLAFSSNTLAVSAATTSALGVVQPDGTIITDTAGAITVAKGSSSAFGVLECGSGTSCSAGVISVSGGTGTVNSGTSGYVAYYPSTGTAVSGEQYVTLAQGGAAAALTASNGGVVYSAASSLAVLAGTATASLPLLSGSTAAPSWATVAYPSSCATGDLLYGSSATTLACNTGIVANSSGLLTTIDGLTTAGTGVPITEAVSNVTAQSSSQSTVTLATSPAAGSYAIRYYADMSTACTTGSDLVSFQFNWTDGTNARVLTTGTLTLGAAQTTGSYLSGVIPIYVGSGNVTYASTVTGACATGTSAYDIHASLERTQ
jgi:fibronectin-binding autotransporter adhesin